MTDYSFNKKILILSENKFSDKKSSIIFENLKKKGININLSNNINQNFDLYDFVFSNEKINYNKIYNFENIQDIIKVLLENENKLSKRMLILKDLYKDMDGIILACGPSLKDCNLKKLKEKENDLIIISVKTATNKLLDNNIIPDVCLFSEWMNSLKHIYTLEYCKKKYNKLFTVYNHDNPSKDNKSFIFNTKPWRSCYNEMCDHNLTFFNIKEYEDLDYIKFDKNFILNEFLHVKPGHMMLELALPMMLHLGCKNIYTYGWDGSKKNSVYFDGRKLKNTDETQVHEFIYVKHILKMFNKQNIGLFKCSSRSPNELPLKNILI
jgi:hypothetical protein